MAVSISSVEAFNGTVKITAIEDGKEVVDLITPDEARHRAHALGDMVAHAKYKIDKNTCLDRINKLLTAARDAEQHANAIILKP